MGTENCWSLTDGQDYAIYRLSKEYQNWLEIEIPQEDKTAWEKMIKANINNMMGYGLARSHVQNGGYRVEPFSFSLEKFPKQMSEYAAIAHLIFAINLISKILGINDDRINLDKYGQDLKDLIYAHRFTITYI